MPAYQAVADIIRTTLGPRSMLKMLLDASGGLCLHLLNYFVTLLLRILVNHTFLQYSLVSTLLTITAHLHACVLSICLMPILFLLINRNCGDK